MSQKATAQPHVRIPPEENPELAAEALRHGISMSAVVRINLMTARERREREATNREMYPRV